MILKSDDEPAIKSLKAAVQREMGAAVRTEVSPPYDDPAKGGENTVRRLKGQVRTIRSGLENHMGVTVERSHPIVPWMIRHAGALITRYQVGPDGKTAHERLRGRAYDRAVAEFGEKVLYFCLGPMVEGSETGGR